MAERNSLKEKSFLKDSKNDCTRPEYLKNKNTVHWYRNYS